MKKFDYYPSHYYPKYVVWEVTFICNMNCHHCGSIAGDGKSRPGELSTEEALNLCQQLKELGTEWVTLSGGELFLRPDWHLIAKQLKEYNIKLSLITNGWLLENNLKYIEEIKPDYIGISIDGTEEIHDFIRRKKGSFEKVSKGFDLLNEINIKSVGITCISKVNIKDLNNLYKFLKSKKAHAWQLQLIISEGRGKLNPEWIPDMDDLINICDFIAKKRLVENDLLIYPGDNIGYYSEYENYIRENKWLGCFAGILGMGIEANGGIKGCLSLCPEFFTDNPFVEGNVKNERLKDIWNKKGAFSYNRNFDKRKVKGACKKCDYLYYCRCGCTATAYAITKSRYENIYCVYRALKEKNKTPSLPPLICPVKIFP